MTLRGILDGLLSPLSRMEDGSSLKDKLKGKSNKSQVQECPGCCK